MSSKFLVIIFLKSKLNLPDNIQLFDQDNINLFFRQNESNAFIKIIQKIVFKYFWIKSLQNRQYVTVHDWK